MKKTIYILSFALSTILFFTSCEDDYEFGDIKTPTNIDVQVDKVGADANNPNGDGSGTVNFTATADNATAFHFVIQNQKKLAKGGSVSHDFAVLGLNTFDITVVAFGTAGSSSSKTIQIEVLSLYEPPADLLEMLHGGAEKSWRIKGEAKPHFGLGPPGGSIPGEWFSAEPDSKAGVGMYNDRYLFNVDGTFTHITNIDSGDNTGDVFGRDGLIDELGVSGGSVDGADILNLPYNDYTETWSLSAPSGVETISISGLGFVGYYTGGDHKYRIFSRNDTEMILSTEDGNGEFEWWFTLTTE